MDRFAGIGLSEGSITLIILFALVGTFLLDLISNYLNIGHLNPNLPREFSGHCDQGEYKKSQQYLKTNTRFRLITTSLDRVLLLGFWFIGGFSLLDQTINGLDHHYILSGLLFMAIPMGLRWLIFFPFKIYSTFHIEGKFGFNTYTPGLFVKDTLKSMALGLGFGIPLVSLILWIFHGLGPWAWIYGWGASTLLILAMQFIIPTWIMPLFNTFTPLEDSPLKQAIFDYARSIDFPLTQIFVMDGSKRSTKSNAFFTGFGSTKRIVLFDTLIQRHTTEELVGVLAHEMGHYKKRHILKRMVLAIAHMGIMFFLLSLCLSEESLFAAFGTQPSIHAGLIFFGLLMTPVDAIVSLFFQSASRKDEYEADAFAAKTTGTCEDLISALKKLSTHNLSNLTPHPLYVFLNYSHPPVLDRIRALRKI